MAEGEDHSTSVALGSLPQLQVMDLRCLKRMSREKWKLLRGQSDEAESREMVDREPTAAAASQDKEKEKEKDAGSWSAQATSALMHSFQQKRIAKKRMESDWRIFRAEDWSDVALWVNQQCALDGSKDWKTGKQCKYKIFNMKRRYKIEKDMMVQRGGGGAPEWGWFVKMEALMGEPAAEAGWHYASSAMEGPDADRRGDMATAFLHYQLGEKRVHEEQPHNYFSSPGSKSTSTTNLDGGSRGGCELEQDHEIQSESSPQSSTPKLVWRNGKEPPVKKHCGDGGEAPTMRPLETFQSSIEQSMQLMARQQGEMILLMKEMVAQKAKQTQELENCMESSTKEILELRKKIDSVERDVMSLRLICDHKRREWNESMDAYLEKSSHRHELLNKLLEILGKSCRSTRKVLCQV